MPREHFNDVPGDIAASHADNLPGGFGADDPDANADATMDDLTGHDVMNPDGKAFASQDEHGGVTAGTWQTGAADEGASVPMEDLLTDEEGHPGAAVGVTGAEPDKRTPPVTPTRRRPETPAGGTPTEAQQAQQARDRSVESEGPTGGQGAAGGIDPDRDQAA